MNHHLITTIPAIALHRCGALTLTGIAEGLHARVDPTPLNRVGHAAAVLTGRQAYTLTRAGLVHLDATRIGDHRIRGPTLATHQCGHAPPPEHIQATPAPSPNNNPEGIPF